MSSTNNDSGPPPWADPDDRVSEREDGSVDVGPEPADAARERAESAGSQMDRIEAKIDWLIAQMEEA